MTEQAMAGWTVLLAIAAVVAAIVLAGAGML
jgi:hypothetical protein